MSLQRSLKLPIKKVEVLLILLLCLTFLFIWWRFRHIVKAMANIENILNDDDFFPDAVDRPKEGIRQHRKRECLT